MMDGVCFIWLLLVAGLLLELTLTLTLTGTFANEDSTLSHWQIESGCSGKKGLMTRFLAQTHPGRDIEILAVGD